MGAARVWGGVLTNGAEHSGRAARPGRPGADAGGKRFNVWTIGALAIIGLAVFLAWRLLTPGGPLAVSVVNSTPSQIDGLALVTAAGFRTPLPAVAVDDSATVRPRLGEGEDELFLVDAEGREYYLLGPFEDNPGGEATIVIRRVSVLGLEGEVVASSDYLRTDEAALEPARE